MTATSSPTPTPTPYGFGTITAQVSASADDAEEAVSNGRVDLTSTDLELVADGTTTQWVGMRFNNLAIPPGSNILSAYIEFEVDELDSGPTSVTIRGEAADNAPTFTATTRNISTRPLTVAQVAWNDIPAWTVVNAKWQTPDISAVLQEIVNRPGWASGNSLAIIISGAGERTAESYDGEPPAAPKLVITYSMDETSTLTPTSTPTATATHTPSPTATDTLAPSGTPTPTATNNLAPSDTPTPTVTDTPAPTNTPTFTSTATATPTATMTPSPTPAADLIFADGFESGALSVWSSVATDGGDLNANPSAALVGNYGLQAAINNTTSIYVTDDTPNTETRYRARFYFDPNSITMAGGNAHYIFYGYTGASTVVLRVELQRSSGNYQLRAVVRNDKSNWASSNWLTFSDAPHFIEVDWRAATAPGANNGGLTLWIDGVQQVNLTGVDNDTRRIDRARLGAVSGLDSGTLGVYYFDAFESRRQTYIGPALGSP